MVTRLRTLLGDHPGTMALKNGSINSASVGSISPTMAKPFAARHLEIWLVPDP